jgi:hypothetical protein
MTGHCAKFGRKKEEAIAALLTQRNVEFVVVVNLPCCTRYTELMFTPPRLVH